MIITFHEAQKALEHLQKQQQPNGLQIKPPLLTLKGKDRALKIYQLKTDLRRTFEAEIERYVDLSREGRDIIQKEKTEEDKKKKKKLSDQFVEINNEIEEMFEEEKEIELKAGKLTANEIDEVLNAEILDDLNFAIELNGEQE